MVNKARKVRKNKTTRVRRKLLLIATEGRNKTEESYFKELERKLNSYHIIFANGNETDPVNILKNTVRAKNRESLSSRRGDMAISLFDLDVDDTKMSQLSEAKKIAKTGQVTIVTSNPCFEVWYLEHFGYTSKYFNSSSEVIRELEKYCPNYQKNRCDIDVFYPLANNAIRNCRLLDEHHRKLGKERIAEFNNPRTDVYKIVEAMIGYK